jgi:hypothetical protein
MRPRATTHPATTAPMQMLRAFRHRSFSLLWAGHTVSRVGDFLYQVALLALAHPAIRQLD